VFSAVPPFGLGYIAASLLIHRYGGSPHIPGPASVNLTWIGVAAAGGVIAYLVNNLLILFALHLSNPEISLRAAAYPEDGIYEDVIEVCIGLLIAEATRISSVSLIFALPFVMLYRRFVMHAQLRAAARLDGKTGLLNATTWQAEAEVEVARAVRTRAPLAIVMIDIDHFKWVNDTYGHLAGDRVLQGLATEFKTHLRDYDQLGRFGGRGILRRAAPDRAGRGRQGRRASARMRVQTRRAHRRRRGHLPIVVTVSIGVAILDGSQTRVQRPVRRRRRRTLQSQERRTKPRPHRPGRRLRSPGPATMNGQNAKERSYRRAA